MAKKRLDLLLVEQGLIATREKAKTTIMAGLVFVNNQRADKPGMLIAEEALLRVQGAAIPFVSRGGLKLAKALEAFQLELLDKVMLDIGASTGGFTDCALQNGASKVYAVDVGYGQLAWKLRQDPRVTNLERTNIRHLEFDKLGELSDLATIDASFISLTLILPKAIELTKPTGEIVALIKPQFEAGKAKVGKKGVVRDPAVHREVIQKIVTFARELGLGIKGLDYSPVKGPEGNIEYLLYLTKAPILAAEGQAQIVAVEELIGAVIKRAHNGLGVMRVAKLMDGKAIAAVIKTEITTDVEHLKNTGIQPKLAVVLVGDDHASVVYAKSKQKVSTSLGFEYELFELPTTTSDEQVLAVIQQLNDDKTVHGIMIELPLPKQLSKAKILAAISPLKDVDGVHPINRGYIMSGETGLFPATPQSCIEIIKRSGIQIAGKHTVIVGRGETVGKPLVFLILKEDATVTVCHSKTPDLGLFTRQADILVVAVGKAKMITADMIKPGATVVDAGINDFEGGICGDVDFAKAQNVAGQITPVPGGVGALTTVLILQNVLKALKLQQSLLGEEV